MYSTICLRMSFSNILDIMHRREMRLQSEGEEGFKTFFNGRILLSFQALEILFKIIDLLNKY